MNLNQLLCFQALARNEHYTKTAESLSIAQSSLSRTINQLETELGTYLFEKKGRSVTLTKQGRIFYEYVDQGLQQINQGVKAVQESLDPSHGIIDFAFIYALSPTYIPQTIQQFLKNPATKNYSFRFYQGNSRKILPGIQDGSYDLGICSYLDIEPELDFTPIIRQEYVLIVGNHHPLASKNRVTLEEAARYDFIMPLDQTSFVEKLFQRHHLSPHITSRVEEDHAAASLVSINLGLAILPRNPMLDQYGIRQISFAPEPVYRDFYLVRRKNGGMTPAAEKFYRYLKESGQVIFRNTENS
ncbi:MAG: LysR family transcriptional regulator [Clostridiales bacterium]|nr:LysR family transcriptional regulator [Clostridiales bacterium]